MHNSPYDDYVLLLLVIKSDWYYRGMDLFDVEKIKIVSERDYALFNITTTFQV